MKNNINMNIVAKNCFRPYLYIIIILLFSAATKDANTQSFTMSSIGSYEGTTALSNTISFKGIAECLDVQTGLAVLRGFRNEASFNMNCKVNLVFNQLSIKMFPIPTQKNAIVKLENLIPNSEEYNLSVWTLDGTKLLQRKEFGFDLAQGIALDLTVLPIGTYVLRVESSKHAEAIKFIKGF